MSLTTYTLFDGYSALDPWEALKFCEENEYNTSWFSKVNSYKCPLGGAAGGGAVLIDAVTLSKLELNGLHYLEFGTVPASPALQIILNSRIYKIPTNSVYQYHNTPFSYLSPTGVVGGGYTVFGANKPINIHEQGTISVTFGDADYTNCTSVYLGPFVITYTENITPSILSGDPKGLYLVEFKDYRHILETVPVPIDLQVNILCPVPEISNFYLNSIWTDGQNYQPFIWDKLVETIWYINGKLGVYPGLPYTPSGLPEGYHFLGESSYKILNEILTKLNCSLQFDPCLGTFNIIQIGGADLSFPILLNYWNSVAKIDDENALTSNRSKAAAIVRVYFYKKQIHYGAEITTVITGNTWITNSYTYIDSPTGILGAEPQSFHIIWDDLSALTNNSDIIQNQNELTLRANNLTQTYISQITDGALRRRMVFSGAIPDFIPGPLLKGVAWKNDGITGLTTEIYNYLWNESQTLETLKPPAFARRAVPNYFPQIQVLQIIDINPVDTNVYQGNLLRYNLDTKVFEVIEPVFLLLEEIPVLNGKYFGRVYGTDTLIVNKKSLTLSFYVSICCGTTGTAPSAPNIAIVQVTSPTPIEVANGTPYYPGQLITYTIDNQDKLTTTISSSVLISSPTIPDINIPVIATKIGNSIKTGFPVYLIELITERIVQVTTLNPAKPGTYTGTMFTIDYSKNTINPDGPCYIQDLKNGIINQTIYYLARYTGLILINGQLLPSFVIKSDDIRLTTLSGKIDVIGLKTVILDDNFFTVITSTNNTVTVIGQTIQNSGVPFPHRPNINFTSLPFDPSSPKTPLSVVDDPINNITNVIFTIPPASLLVPVKLPLFYDTNNILNLKIPLQVIYGGTGTSSLIKNSIIIGNNLDSVLQIPVGLNYSILNTLNGNGTSPVFTQDPIIKNTVTIGVLGAGNKFLTPTNPIAIVLDNVNGTAIFALDNVNQLRVITPGLGTYTPLVPKAVIFPTSTLGITQTPLGSPLNIPTINYTTTPGNLSYILRPAGGVYNLYINDNTFTINPGDLNLVPAPPGNVAPYILKVTGARGEDFNLLRDNPVVQNILSLGQSGTFGAGGVVVPYAFLDSIAKYGFNNNIVTDFILGYSYNNIAVPSPNITVDNISSLLNLANLDINDTNIHNILIILGLIISPDSNGFSPSTGTLILNNETSTAPSALSSGVNDLDDKGELIVLPDKKTGSILADLKSLLYVSSVTTNQIKGINYRSLNTQWSTKPSDESVLYNDPTLATLAFSNYPTLKQGVALGKLGSTTGTLQFNNKTNTNTLKLQAGATDKNTELILPFHTPKNIDGNYFLHINGVAPNGDVILDWYKLFLGTITVPTAFCAVKSSGNITDLKVSYTNYQVVLYSQATGSECQVVPSTNCCIGGGGVTTVTVPCCTNSIKSNLFATMTPSFINGCPCFPNSQTIVVTWDGSSMWIGTSAFGTCGRNITVRLRCNGTSWESSVEFSDGCFEGANFWHSNTSIDGGGTPIQCSPFNAQFHFSSPIGIGFCGCTGSGGPLFITFTE